MNVRSAYRFLGLLVTGVVLLWAAPFEVVRAQSAKPASELMTLTGCLRSSAAGDSKTAPQPVVYTLDVAATPQGKSKAAPGQPAGPKSRAPLTPSQYTLSAPAAVGLATHVNHRVELKGRMREGNATTTGTPGKPSPETAQAVDPIAAAANRTFHVESLKMISATCPAPTTGESRP